LKFLNLPLLAARIKCASFKERGTLPEHPMTGKGPHQHLLTGLREPW
jgi:hypothetical protein